jgi:hypothetical protein
MGLLHSGQRISSEQLLLAQRILTLVTPIAWAENDPSTMATIMDTVKNP